MHRGRARLTRARPCVPGLNLSDPAAVKMMVVPRARGPCWLCELPRDAATELLVRTLRARITDVHVLEAVSTADQILDANLERLARSPADLASLVRSVEAALARHEAQGRPLLL